MNIVGSNSKKIVNRVGIFNGRVVIINNYREQCFDEQYSLDEQYPYLFMRPTKYNGHIPGSWDQPMYMGFVFTRTLYSQSMAMDSHANLKLAPSLSLTIYINHKQENTPPNSRMT